MKTPSLLLIFCAAPLSAQDTFTVDWSVISSGGSQAAGAAEFTCSSSIGQPAAGLPGGAVPGEFSMESGYWTAEEEPMDVGLSMAISGPQVILTWDGTRGIPLLLESSDDLTLWLLLDDNPQPPWHDTPVTRKFYRLRRGDE